MTNRPIFLTISSVMGVLALSACQRPDQPAQLAQRLNAKCDVSFRRGDALGAAAPYPVPAHSDAINGAELTMAGKLVAVDSQGIVLRDERAKRDHWIPLAAILRISFPLP